MTQILDRYQHVLRFYIDNDAPNSYKKKFSELKNQVENGRVANVHFSEKVINFCRLESNKNLPILNRCEGGLGGNNNTENKQLRYRLRTVGNIDNDIKINIINSDKEKWTYDELDDLVESYIELFDSYMGAIGVNGYIELINLSIDVLK